MPVRFQPLCVVVLACLAAACGSPPAPPAETAAPAAARGSATVSGQIVLDGEPPPPGILRLDGDRTCVELNGGPEREAETLVVGPQGGVKNVFVYVKDGLERHSFMPPVEPVVLDQQRCRYEPRVLGIQAGQPLEIRNSDALLHNVRTDAEINQGFNVGQPVAGIRTTKTFTTREVMVPVGCDVHGWMRAYIGVLDHPYFAVTGDDGQYTLPNLPAGTYTVEAWHETLGTSTHTVTVDEGGSARADFTFPLS